MTPDDAQDQISDQQWLKLDNQVCFALYAANRALTALYRPLLETLGLTYPQYLVMLVLWESREPVTVSRLGTRLRLDSGTLTPLLKRLESRGLVKRLRSREDERVVELVLTQEGQDLRDQARSVPRDILCRSGLAPEDALDLRDQLRALLARIDEQAL